MVIDKYARYMKNLPVVPEVAAKILNVAESKLDISFKELENIIKVDPLLTTKILKIANSALYARQREITSLQMAITLLGFKNIKSLVLLVTASNAFTRFKGTAFYQHFWRQSILTAFATKHIAVRCGRREQAEEAFLGALLHNVGQVAFFSADRERYKEIFNRSKAGEVELESLEQKAYGFSHRELGSLILQEWNFPEFFVDVAREHERVNITSPHKALIIIISIAKLLVDIYLLDLGTPETQQLLDTLFPHTDLQESDLEYYRTRFLEDLKKDPLFRECQSLFGIGD